MKSLITIISIAIMAVFALLGLIYKNPFQVTVPFASQLPAINALLNGLSAICLIGGLVTILKKNITQHRLWMTSAFLFSTLFLISYVLYHATHGDTLFLGTGWIRPVYFFILISHISLSAIALPIILVTFYFALTQRIVQHKRLARWTWPLWFYVSITGVLVYLILYG